VDHVLRGIASAGGIGFLPRGAATAASLVGGGAWLLFQPGVALQIVMIGAAILIGQACAQRLAEPALPDPQNIVIDEVAGVWVALVGLDLDVATCAVGVVIFRLFDKSKPWPIRVIHKRGGRVALMGDDLVAGLIANGLIRTGLAVHGWLV
jgi:phosphatidylglycerophosphatase A